MTSKTTASDPLDTEYKIYSYVTLDYEPGTIVAHPDLAVIFDENKLFKMDKVSVKTLKLRDILEKGYISVGSTDIMDTLNIVYSKSNKTKPIVKGNYMHGSRRKLISDTTGIDFAYEPESELENDDEFESFNANEDDSCENLSWLSECK